MPTDRQVVANVLQGVERRLGRPLGHPGELTQNEAARLADLGYHAPNTRGGTDVYLDAVAAIRGVAQQQPARPDQRQVPKGRTMTKSQTQRDREDLALGAEYAANDRCRHVAERVERALNLRPEAITASRYVALGRMLAELRHRGSFGSPGSMSERSFQTIRDLQDEMRAAERAADQVALARGDLRDEALNGLERQIAARMWASTRGAA